MSDSGEKPKNKTESQKQNISAIDIDNDINDIFCKDSTVKPIGEYNELSEILDKLYYKYQTKI